MQAASVDSGVHWGGLGGVGQCPKLTGSSYGHWHHPSWFWDPNAMGSCDCGIPILWDPHSGIIVTLGPMGLGIPVRTGTLTVGSQFHGIPVTGIPILMGLL